MRENTLQRAWEAAGYSRNRRKAKRLAHVMIRASGPYINLRTLTAAQSRRAILTACLRHACLG